MSDPFKIYEEQTPAKRETLKLIWPDLHAVLDAHVNAKRAIPPACAIAPHAVRQAATGRVTLNGTPACSLHLATLSERQGGYPLDVVDPREWDR